MTRLCTSTELMKMLSEFFGDRLIFQESPNLSTPLDYFMWGYQEDEIFAVSQRILLIRISKFKKKYKMCNRVF